MYLGHCNREEDFALMLSNLRVFKAGQPDAQACQIKQYSSGNVRQVAGEELSFFLNLLKVVPIQIQELLHL